MEQIAPLSFLDCPQLKKVEIAEQNQHYCIRDSLLLSKDGKKLVRCLTNPDSVVIPQGVTSIEYWAFSCCTNLASIAIPQSVTKIGMGAFNGCTSLASVVIPSITTFVSNAFPETCHVIRAE